MKMGKAACPIIEQASEGSFRSSDFKGSKNSKKRSELKWFSSNYLFYICRCSFSHGIMV